MTSNCPRFAYLPRRRLLTILISQALAAGAFTNIHAATIDLNSCAADDLINAIETANSNDEADVINLNGDCIYTLTAIYDIKEGDNGLPLIYSTITINGNGAAIERSSEPGTPAFRLIRIAESGDLTLGHTIIRNGVAIDSPYTIYGGSGGGLSNQGTVTLTKCTLTGNTAYIGGGFNNTSGIVALDNTTLAGNTASTGGGFNNTSGIVTLDNSILTDNSASRWGGGFETSRSGTVTLISSTLSRNSASTGGGFDNFSSGTVALTNSTLSDNSAVNGGGFFSSTYSMVTIANSTLSANSASEKGGGFYNDNNTYVPSEVTVTNSTLSGNAAAIGGGLYSELSNSVVVTRLTNTIVASSLGGNCAGDSLVTDVANLFDDATCNGTAIVNINLDSNLSDNGGPTQTHALLAGSAAIDAGMDCSVPPVNGLDQRSFERDALCDIGAFEFNSVLPGDDIGVQRGGQWFLDRNRNGQWDGCTVDACYVFGALNDQPVAGDWNGDGFDEIGTLRNGQWFLDNGNGAWDGCGNFPIQDRCLQFGTPGDQPIAGDWNGDGVTEIGVRRGASWFLDNGNGSWDGCGYFPANDACISQFGHPSDQPVTGDWNGDRFTTIGIRRGESWFLDNGNGVWDGCGAPPAQDICISSFGQPTDQAVVGDWNSDGVTSIGVKRNRDWFLDGNSDDAWGDCTTDLCIFGWGALVDEPISGRWKP